uniref:hypothetical protein n=1 Tax=Jatropha curcas TaxID=180498 RepID=UPI00279E3618|nr:hypothetical protein QLP06_mgp096 [Jatropha curcas]WFG81143.1 hypothetical protein [Jatropha curcas]
MKVKKAHDKFFLQEKEGHLIIRLEKRRGEPYHTTLPSLITKKKGKLHRKQLHLAKPWIKGLTLIFFSIGYVYHSLKIDQLKKGKTREIKALHPMPRSWLN